MENHNQHGKSHADSDSVGKAQEESGQEAHQPDQLWKERSVAGHSTVPWAGAWLWMENGWNLDPKKHTAHDQKAKV